MTLGWISVDIMGFFQHAKAPCFYCESLMVALVGNEGSKMTGGTKLKTCLIISVLSLAMVSSATGKIIFVDSDATGANNGSSWVDAYKYLQDALADANSGDEIRVAEGIYAPDSNSAYPGGSGDRTAAFQLVNGVAINGGYAGFGELDPNVRDIEAYETILSGDLNGDDIDVDDPCDLLNEPTRAENSYHVVTAIRKDAVLDGFTITGGNANGSDPWPHRNGSGGGIYIDTVEKKPKVSNCIFRRNSSIHYGGGMCYTSIGRGRTELTNCTFIKNWAGAGGGVYDGSYGSPIRTLILTNCRFLNNSAVKGGGMCIGHSRPTLTNCIFIGNSADFGGASAHCDSAIATYSKCTFAANSAQYGKAMFCSSCLYTRSRNIVRLNNCIVWDGGEEIHNDSNSIITIIYSDVQGGQASVYDPFDGLFWGAGNIDVDPCFADANNGDYHLKSQAGRWTSASSVEPDANEGRWTMDEVTSPCIDAGNTNSPVGLEPFPNGGVINMGAYGGTAEASKSYFGEPLCETIVAGDINGDCIVNFKDLAFMAFHWLEDKGAANSKTIIEDGIEYYVKTDKTVYELGEHTEILYRITNLTDEVWGVGSMGRIMDILVEIKEGENFREVWRYGWEHSTLPGPQFLGLQPGESTVLGAPWPQFSMKRTGDPWEYHQAPPGTYRITGVVDGYRTRPEPQMEIHSRVSVDITVVY